MEYCKIEGTGDDVRGFLEEKSSSIFTTSSWLGILNRGFGREVDTYCCKDKGRMLFCLSGIRLDLKFIKIFYANIPYGGFVGDPRDVEGFLRYLEGKLKKEGIHQIKIVQTAFTDYDMPPGYGRSEGFQHILPLESFGELSSSITRNVRKAEKNNIIIENISRREEIEDLYSLYINTMVRNNFYPIWTKDILYEVYDILLPSRKADIFFAKMEGKPIAGLVLFYFKDCAYYFVGASLTRHLSLRPNDLLFNHALKLCSEKGLKYFDFMTSSMEDESLIRFKEKWGGRKHIFTVYEKSLNVPRVETAKLLWRLMKVSFFSRFYLKVRYRRP